MRKTFYEIFTEVEKCKTKKEKIAKLRENSSAAMKAVLGHTYDPGVRWLYQKVIRHTSQRDVVDVQGQFVSELRKLYLFIDVPSETQRNLKQIRREQLFIEMLENIDFEDAKVLLGMKDGKLPFKGLTRKLVAEAFPSISKNW